MLSNRLFTLRRYPIRYLVIPKCGCTFVKNLLWQLERGEVHPNPLRIHDSDDEFLRVSDLELTDEDIRAEDYAFTVLRNPVDRFFSLYSDKVIGDGHKTFVPLRSILIGHGLNPQANSVKDHQGNCELMADWLKSNIANGVDLEPEAHWTPQTYRLNVIRAFDLKLMVSNHLNDQIEALLSGLIPDIREIAESLETNRSSKDFAKSEILTKPLRKKINEVYADDRELFQKARDTWTSRKDRPGIKSGPQKIPRHSDLS
ncbi:MAG: sulfotransferase family 2 domain-containing protein [Pseudomonadota bacterium]